MRHLPLFHWPVLDEGFVSRCNIRYLQMYGMMRLRSGNEVSLTVAERYEINGGTRNTHQVAGMVCIYSSYVVVTRVHITK